MLITYTGSDSFFIERGFFDDFGQADLDISLVV